MSKLILLLSFFAAHLLQFNFASANQDCSTVIAPSKSAIARTVRIKSPTPIRDQCDFGTCTFEAHVSRLEMIYFLNTGQVEHLTSQNLSLSALIDKILAAKKAGHSSYKWQGATYLDFTAAVRKSGFVPIRYWLGESIEFKSSFGDLLEKLYASYNREIPLDNVTFEDLYRAQTMIFSGVDSDFDLIEFNSQFVDSIGFGQLYGLQEYNIEGNSEDNKILDKIISAINNNRPVSAIIRANLNVENSKHMVVLVGYALDQDGNLEHLIYQNSWSETWGDGGYGYINIVDVPRKLKAVFLE